MPVNPLSLENLVNLPRLDSGVTSEVHRVRASTEVQMWFRTMSAKGRGDLLAQVMAGAPAEAGVGGNARRISEGHSRGSQSLEGVTLLRVAATALPSSLRNTLRWSPGRYADLEAVLLGTEHIRLDRSSGKPVWRADDGEHVRRDTVVRLLDAGVLVKESQPPDGPS